ncbi:hypothetical protein N185_02390 [Sinorhizobium sp. GW3]|nr:hypothetical protein N185_02390 [Sinorhizobium sp. GW3]
MKRFPFGIGHLKKQFQEKCEAVFRPESRHLKKQFQEKCETVFRPESRHLKKQFQEKCEALVRPESIEIPYTPAASSFERNLSRGLEHSI